MEGEDAFHKFALEYDRFDEFHIVFEFLGFMMGVKHIETRAGLYLAIIGHEFLSHVNNDIFLLLMHSLNGAILLFEIDLDVSVFQVGLLFRDLIIEFKLP